MRNGEQPSRRIAVNDALEIAVRKALMTDNPDPGMIAHDAFMAMAREPGLDYGRRNGPFNVYEIALHNAGIAELIATLVSRSQKRRCREIGSSWAWNSAAFMDASGRYLRRFLPVTRWSRERETYETMSWFGLGETAMLEMPMQLIVAVLGPNISGRRYSPWAKGWWHQNYQKLRFRKHSDPYQQFQGKWTAVWREGQQKVDREGWLQAMLDDNVFPDLLFVIDIPVPNKEQREKIRYLAEQKWDRLRRLQTMPEVQFTSCFDLIQPCPFLADCHGNLPEATRISTEPTDDANLDGQAGVNDRVSVVGPPLRYGKPIV